MTPGQRAGLESSKEEADFDRAEWGERDWPGFRSWLVEAGGRVGLILGWIWLLTGFSPCRTVTGTRVTIWWWTFPMR